MKIDSERIAARLRIEQEILNDKLEQNNISRSRRQLGGGNPAEINIQVTAPLFSSRLFEYGIDAGDDELPQQLDAYKKFSLRYPIKFYGREYTTINILANGAIGLDENSKVYKLNVLPGNMKLIAPFWNRNNLLTGGAVYFREITSGRVLERGQSEIRYQYDKSIHVKSAVVITWDRMQPVGDKVLPEENTNTFQMVIFNTDDGSYANFVYSNIGWTQGAEAGFSNGNNQDHFALPTSGTGNIMYLEEYGNTGIPGEWMFEMGDKRIIRCKLGIKGNTCDEQCPPGEWGSDCANCCHCQTGSCNTLNGECAVGICSECYTGPSCSIRKDNCQSFSNLTSCASNAIAFIDLDKCGEPQQNCKCMSGYEGDGYHVCTDINECNDPKVCHEDAICTNTPGKYFCQCKDGYIGDGITTCESNFLYKDTTGSVQELHKSKNSKITWQLRNPLVIFGILKKDILITSTGLISLVKNPSQIDISKYFNENSHLENLDGQIIAPFYAPIDLSKNGRVTISETNDPNLLKRATRTVADNIPNNESFMATSLFIVTYRDVTSFFNPSLKNSFQIVLIGGRSRNGDDVTYAHILYKDISWSENAEAGIISSEKDSFVLLPGSGVDRLDQLVSTSNINLPGEWVYKIDKHQISSCLKNTLQPPYCDKVLHQNKNIPLRVENSNTFKSLSTNPTPLKVTDTSEETTKEEEDDLDTDSSVVTFPPFLTVIPQIMVSSEKPKLSINKNSQVIEILNPVQKIVPDTNFITSEKSTKKVLSTSLPQKTTVTLTSTIPTEESTTTHSSIIKSKPTETLFANDDGSHITQGKPIYIFTTARPLPTKTTNINSLRTTLLPSISKSSSQSKNAQFDITKSNKESTNSSFFFIFTVSGVIALWLLIVIIMGIVICCKKRKSQVGFATIYGPAYHVHPITNTLSAPYGMVRKNSTTGYDDYEDGVDKQARLSNEFSSYNQTTGRISLYGSHWNLPTPLAGAHIGPAAFINPNIRFHEALHHHNNIVIPSSGGYNYSVNSHATTLSMGKNFDGVRKLGNLNGMKNQQMINGHGGSLNTDSTISDSISSTPPLINDTNQRMSPKILTATSMEPANTKVLHQTKDTHKEQVDSLIPDIKRNIQTSSTKTSYFRENLI
ncbi:Epidermal growth factor-like domain and EGF-like calcium-binding domain and Nidogen, extracellular domain and Green fluorescent protein-like domain-containing protein [Strongyloides ratti]|uniref:Epidermal growth factor-like domain and EGF-like calcium-binding domain and Nidogen, extracellular domain and Green fluorescent protein-like domain-containing protein n=1 Tax=Strongyloides ratti TaxID=34506 RepID=A0A090LM16_STRRB|nr:Epidermal growth factor-like domain and EGF-like calcium-binding domain and Nidogen, extracellular domain and Green fluorescent protein-like domain-containing protein [Strongyloides ratti]CEF68605.1 Epidermal growth factor-like domain and EGF-like calcium-binding domain and Nidogen, extracellular domain and Green fluorescent protein-like domain-containing protein [Strongyloides ratti]